MQKETFVLIVYMRVSMRSFYHRLNVTSSCTVIRFQRARARVREKTARHIIKITIFQNRTCIQLILLADDTETRRQAHEMLHLKTYYITAHRIVNDNNYNDKNERT